MSEENQDVNESNAIVVPKIVTEKTREPEPNPGASAMASDKNLNVLNTVDQEDKTFNATDVKGASTLIDDLEVFGNGDLFQLLSKASSKSQKWMKSTKAMEIDGVGCVIQVTNQQGENVAEALTFVPGVRVGRPHRASKDKCLVKI